MALTHYLREAAHPTSTGAVEQAMDNARVFTGSRTTTGRRGLAVVHGVADPPLSYGDVSSERLLDELDRTSVNRMPVTLVGEPGTGKKLAARALHRASRHQLPRAFEGHPQPSTDLSQEEVMAYIVSQGRRSLGPARNLTLSNLNLLPGALQHRWLRLLKRGADESRSMGRWVVTSSALPSQLASEARLLPELATLLGSQAIELPPLRKRPRDLAPMVRELTVRAANRFGCRAPQWSEEVLAFLADQSWPGNVRQLNFVVEASVARGSEVIASDHLPWLREVLGLVPLRFEGAPFAAAKASLPQEMKHMETGAGRFASLAEVEERQIRRALRQFGGHRRKSAEALGISERTLYAKLRSYAKQLVSPG